MPFNNNITPGTPPLLWSNMYEAFRQVNENFTALQLAIGGGVNPVDLATLDTDVSPTADNTYSLGSQTNSWKSVFTSAYSPTTPGDNLNGVWLGDAHIQGLPAEGALPARVNLPAGSSVDGSLIIDPEKTFFKEVSVDNNESLIADSFGAALNLNSGLGIQLVVDSSGESISINNEGIINVVGSTGISVAVNPTTNVATVSNTGVLSLGNSTTLPPIALGRSTGAGIIVNRADGNITITNTGVLEVEAGFGINVELDEATGIVTVSNNAPAQAAFQRIAITGTPAQVTLSPETTNDVVTFNAGYGMILNTDDGNDVVTFTVDQRIDIIGSVFGDDSSLLVDAVDNFIYGNVRATTLRTAETKIALGADTGVTAQGNDSVAIGNNSGNNSQGSSAVAIGYNAGTTLQGSTAVAIGYNAGNDNQGTGAVSIGYTTAQVTQGDASVAIGWSAGQQNQGDYAIAIGYRAGFINQNAASIVINASGAALNTTGAGFYVNPIRSTADGRPLMYDPATSEIFSSSVLEFFGNRISTSDSSNITFDVLARFNTDIVAENDLVVDNRTSTKDLVVTNNSTVTNQTSTGTLTVGTTAAVGTTLRVGTKILNSDGTDMVDSVTKTVVINVNNSTTTASQVNATSLLRITPRLTDPGVVPSGTFAVANAAGWDPAGKGSGIYPVFFNGAAWVALY